MSGRDADTTRVVLFHLSEGLDVKRILRVHPSLTRADVQRAAAEALAALETGESREACIARVRRTFPQAFQPWSDAEDGRLMEAFAAGAPLAAIARDHGRPPGAIRARLEKRLGPDWRAGRPGG